jgi:CubicO group peptidase (beta-lactamase class C family)
MKQIFLLLTIFCSLKSLAQTDSNYYSPASFDAIFNKQIDSKTARGISFAFVADGKILFEKGYGYSDMKLTKPADAVNTVFSTASVSKIFATLSLLQLHEKGKCKISDEVNEYLTNYKLKNPFATPVTLFNLMTHTAGFEDKFMGGLTPDASKIIPLDDYIKKFMPAIVMEPGTQISYSNHGGALAGLMAEKISGVSFDKYVQENIFNPLGMQHSSFFQPAPPSLQNNMVRGEYQQPYFNPYPAGACVTTANDMGKLIISLLNDNKILSSESLKQIFSKQWSADPAMPGMGLGFMQSIINGQEVFFHTGDAGQHSLLFLVPQKKIGLYVVYTNIANGSPKDDLVNFVMNKFSSSPFKLPPQPADFAQRAAEYEGNYRSNQYSRTTFEKLGVLPNQFVVSAKPDNSLFIEMLGGEISASLIEIKKDLFISSDSAYFCFIRNKEIKITGIQLAGNLSDPSGFEKIKWWDNVKLHGGLFIFIFLVVIIRIFWSIVSGIKRLVNRNKKKEEESKITKKVWLATGLLSWTLAILLIASLISIVFVPKPIYQIPIPINITLFLLKLIAVMGLLFPIAAFISWKYNWWTTGRRLFFSFFSIALFGLSLLVYYWNL